MRKWCRMREIQETATDIIVDLALLPGIVPNLDIGWGRCRLLELGTVVGRARCG
jgi:hypothetical protein